MPSRVRPATLDDVPLLVRHRRAMWTDMGGFTPAELDEADPVYRRWLRPRMKRGELVAWVVEEKGAPVASGALWIMRIQPRPLAPTGATPYLLSMFTEHEHRGRGHAARIVRAAMRWAKAEGYPRMTLHASEMGRGVYEKLGWERTWEMAYRLTPRAPRRSPRASRSRSRGRTGTT